MNVYTIVAMNIHCTLSVSIVAIHPTSAEEFVSIRAVLHRIIMWME